NGVQAETVYASNCLLAAGYLTDGVGLRIKAWILIRGGGGGANITIIHRIRLGGVSGTILASQAYGVQEVHAHGMIQLEADVMVNSVGAGGTYWCFGEAKMLDMDNGAFDIMTTPDAVSVMEREDIELVVNTTTSKDIVVTYQATGSVSVATVELCFFTVERIG
ncbi:MAG TPA: hypothetical protein VNA25_28575, partial [Phycisphaerae bacterium]|nr:hypothetical protein [Phycisphaerae bacterium]